MVEAIQGKDKFLMVRRLSDAATKPAAKLLLQTSHEYAIENDNDTVETKDGPVVRRGSTSYTLSIEAVTARDTVNLMLEQAANKNEELEFWIVDYGGGLNEEGKYASKYLRGNLNSWSAPSDVSELENLSTEVTVSGIPQDGFVSLTASQEDEIFYAFRDIEATEETAWTEKESSSFVLDVIDPDYSEIEDTDYKN